MGLVPSDDAHAVRTAFQAGAQAYLRNAAAPSVVTDGVRRVLEGGVYADPTVAPLLASGTRVAGTDNTPRELSAREVEVLQLVADGQSNKEIGEALSLSALTVKSHLSRIGRKLGTADRAQVVAPARRPGGRADVEGGGPQGLGRRRDGGRRGPSDSPGHSGL